MSITLTKLWAVHQGDDERHSGKPAWYFTDSFAAQHAASGRGWYGGNAPITERMALLLDDGTAYILESANPVVVNRGPQDEAEIREKALAKLTEMEKKLLGLAKEPR